LKPTFSDRLYADEESTRAKVELAYLRHLQAQDFSDNRDLLTYFGLDFFHDGQIDQVKFSTDLRTVSWRVPVTWISPPEHRREQGLLWANFRCCFEDVVWFQAECERLDGADPLRDMRIPAEFRSSEIDTLANELKFYRRNLRGYLREHESRLHSLLIELAPGLGHLGLVFRRVSVTPEEPLAWEQLVASGQYQIPWCYPPIDRLGAEVARLEEKLNSPAA
jgi:hypothetical protein